MVVKGLVRFVAVSLLAEPKDLSTSSSSFGFLSGLVPTLPGFFLGQAGVGAFMPSGPA